MTEQTFDAFIVKEIADKQYAGRVEQTVSGICLRAKS